LPQVPFEPWISTSIIGEWVLGNTFSCALFFTYGTFWLVQGTSLIPSFAVGTMYSSTGNTLEGITTAEYNATVGFYYVCLTILTFVYMICSLRTIICLFLTLLLLVITFGLFSSTFFTLALEDFELAAKLQKMAGAFNFALCLPMAYFHRANFGCGRFPHHLACGRSKYHCAWEDPKARKRDLEV
ncbi:uncharacterized protein N7473_002388, partial [Penicillium subrubescens]|uniref:uncharacterized protein n=1 Tax=Penicillium subrubescens TaxID=1316194 RepID=UPI002544D492